MPVNFWDFLPPPSRRRIRPDTAGTVQVADLTPGATGSTISNLRVAGGKLYFTPTTTEAGNELYALKLPMTLPEWRQFHFGTSGHTGDGANLLDFDKDGLANLVEYAFDQDPTKPQPHPLPTPQRNGGNYAVSFTQPNGVSGVTYGAEWSTSLTAESWTSIPDTGSGGTHLFSVPTTGRDRIFLRYRVTTP